MPSLKIEIPEEAAAILDAGALEADAVELRNMIAWNIDRRADQLGGWAESSDRPADEVRKLVAELDTLARTFGAL